MMVCGRDCWTVCEEKAKTHDNTHDNAIYLQEARTITPRMRKKHRTTPGKTRRVDHLNRDPLILRTTHVLMQDSRFQGSKVDIHSALQACELFGLLSSQHEDMGCVVSETAARAQNLWTECIHYCSAVSGLQSSCLGCPRPPPLRFNAKSRPRVWQVRSVGNDPEPAKLDSVEAPARIRGTNGC